MVVVCVSVHMHLSSLDFVGVRLFIFCVFVGMVSLLNLETRAFLQVSSVELDLCIILLKFDFIIEYLVFSICSD